MARQAAMKNARELARPCLMPLLAGESSLSRTGFCTWIKARIAVFSRFQLPIHHSGG
jgi:hypothetical protein